LCSVSATSCPDTDGNWSARATRPSARIRRTRAEAASMSLLRSSVRSISAVSVESE